MQHERHVLIQSAFEIADTVSAGVLLVSLLVATNWASMHSRLDSFMAARITLANASLVVSFLLIWHLLFRLTGVYDAFSGCSFREEAQRVFIACSCASCASSRHGIISAISNAP